MAVVRSSEPISLDGVDISGDTYVVTITDPVHQGKKAVNIDGATGEGTILVETTIGCDGIFGGARARNLTIHGYVIHHACPNCTADGFHQDCAQIRGGHDLLFDRCHFLFQEGNHSCFFVNTGNQEAPQNVVFQNGVMGKFRLPGSGDSVVQISTLNQGNGVRNSTLYSVSPTPSGVIYKADRAGQVLEDVEIVPGADNFDELVAAAKAEYSQTPPPPPGPTCEEQLATALLERDEARTQRDEARVLLDLAESKIAQAIGILGG